MISHFFGHRPRVADDSRLVPLLSISATCEARTDFLGFLIGNPDWSGARVGLLISFHCVTVIFRPAQIGLEAFETCVGI
jgi:hypothetical protein